MTTDNNDDRCGLDPVVSPRWDPYRKRACHPHDAAFDARDKTLTQVNLEWVAHTALTAAIGAYAVALFPLYLVGGLVGGTFRWLTHDPSK